MKSVIFYLMLLIILTSCASHVGYETARFRQREYTVNQITLTNGGLTMSEIKSITQTKPPTKFPIDISIIIIKDWRVDNSLEQYFVKNIIDELRKSQAIDRIVPIPKFLLPDKINFKIIQELGIRTLTDYVLVFVIDSELFFKWTQILDTKFELTSAVDYIIVDAKTTAILSSDRLFSKIYYKQNLFRLGEAEKAKNEIFSEQGKILGEQISKLFNSTYNK